MLINVLVCKGDFVNAERFAEMTLSNLKDRKNGMDQEGEESAIGSYNLANVIYQQNGDLIKAEKLARDSLRIRYQLHGDNHWTCESCFLLANILTLQNKVGTETKELYKRFLVVRVRNEGTDGVDVAIGNLHISRFYCKVAALQSTVATQHAQLLIAKSYHTEGLRIQTKIYGQNHSETLNSASQLSEILSQLSTLQQCLNI